MILFIVGIILDLLCFGGFFYLLKKFTKENAKKIEGLNKFLFIGFAVAQGVFTILSSFGVVLANGWVLNVGQNILVGVGSFIFGLAIAVTMASFYLYYWCVDLDSKQRKACRFLMFIAPVVAILGLYLFTEGIASQDIYPLINRLDFEYGFVSNVSTNRNVGSKGGIQFYGVILVSGALICYFITDHETYKKFGEHGLIDSLFIVAFLAGVLGARLWFCLILEPAKYISNPSTIFTGIIDGGLAIQGGAIGGALVGIIFVLIFRKYIDVRFLMDIAIPSILIAQAIGRWGNFMNQEVYGKVAPEWMMNMLPSIVKNNLLIVSPVDNELHYRVPLFLIESLINFGGYFFIRFFLGNVCKFGVGKGYQSAAYITWYGLVRFILEPLREGFTLDVGSSEAFGYMQSWITAMAMIVGGVIMFIVLYLIHKYRMKNGLEDADGNRIKKA